jgi:hypothetical protein
MHAHDDKVSSQPWIVGSVVHTEPGIFREGKSRMVQRQQQNMGEPSEREHYSLYCWIYLQGSA